MHRHGTHARHIPRARAAQPMRNEITAAVSRRETIKRLWKSFFADPSQWWDYRYVQKNAKAPDLQHKATGEKLWLDNTRNPSWVLPLLKKKDKECPSFTQFPSLLEKEKKTSSQEVYYALPAITMEETTLNQDKKKKKNTIEGATLRQKKNAPAPTMEKPNLKQKKQNAGVPTCRIERHAGQSEKIKKSYISGEVCDWHALSLEDSIHALEKGLFSEPSVETLAHIVCKCMKKKDRDYSLRLLAYLQRNGLDFHQDLGNYVVCMLVDVENTHQAQVVFDKLSSRNESTWITLIMGHVKSAEFQQAIDLYKNMRKDRSLHLSGHAFVALSKACIALKDVKVGRLLHADAAKGGLLKTNPVVGNALLDMYLKCGSLAEAQDMFDMLPARNVITWTSLIAGYTHHEHGAAALQCFQLMQDSGVSPNAFTYSSILKACGSLKNSAVGIEVHSKVEQGGLLKTSQIVGNALVDMYAKCGLLTKAQEVFDLLSVRDVVSWNALIAGYTEHACYKEAMMSFDYMQAAGISPNGITFATCLKACAHARAVEKGKEIHLELVARRLLKNDPILGSSLVDMYAKCGLLDKAQAVFDKLLVQDAVAWTSLIAGYTQHDACEKALGCFKQMQAKGVTPDAIAYACGLKACGSVGAANIGIKLHDELARKDLLEEKPLLGNAVVDMYTKFGMLAKACEVFLDLPAPNVASWTALLTGYAQLGDAEKVFYILDRMREWADPTSVTILSVLNACTNAGLVDTALGWVEAMSEDYGLTLLLEHCNCVIDLLGRVGQINRAAVLVFESPFQPNGVMWQTLLGACQKWGHVKLAKEAFEQVIRLDKSEVSAYVCMSNIYIHVGMHEELLSVKESMEEPEASMRQLT